MTALTVAIEGSDGAGKATQTEMLAVYLQEIGYKVGRLSFPRYEGTPAGRMLFEFLKSDRAADYDFVNANPRMASRIYAQDRFDSLDHINELIERNDVVIFDRYVESNLLHQGGKMKSDLEKTDFAKWLFSLEYGELGLPKPDLTIYLNLPYLISYSRAHKRAKEKGEKLDAVESSMEYVRNGWQAGQLYASLFDWKVVECIFDDNPSIPVFERGATEIHKELREMVERKM